MRNKLLISILAVSAAVALACGSSPEVTEAGGDAEAADTSARKPIAVKIGQKLSVNTESLVATYTLSKAKVHASGEYGSKPDKGAWLVAFLRVDVKKGETFACACELSLVQGDGKVREQAYASIDGKPDFESADLKAGQYADGWVMFDLPRSAIAGSKIQLKVSSLFSDSEYGYWTVKV